MSTRAAMIERMEQIAEHRGRNALEPNHASALVDVMNRYPEACPLLRDDITLLFMRFWMHYAAGVRHPEEATDTTLRSWQSDN